MNSGRAARGPGLNPTGLLAKPNRSLVDHTRDVVEAFIALFGRPGAPTDLTARWLKFFRSGDERAFLLNGLAAAVVHDWGKANDGFQRMLKREGDQLLRHEVVSALILDRQSVRGWVSGNPELDPDLIFAAVLGHHLKAGNGSLTKHRTADADGMSLHWDELKAQLPGLVAPLSLPGGVPDDVPGSWSFTPRPRSESLVAALRSARDRLEDLGDELELDEPRRRLLWAVRAALIAADSAGSGLFRTGKDVSAWIAEAFDPRGRLDGDAIERKVIRPRCAQVGDRWRGWNPFQEACGDPGKVPARALLLAPCGSGKTLAAWRWIAARCGERPVGRVVFLYPTRGTATEGYRDYASHAGPEEAALVHGTADLDVETIHPDVKDEDRIREARLFALRQWPRRIFSATVDQFLGFLQHGYGPTCLLPLLADSVVVVDEVHCYDRGMFSALLQFLEHFDVPVLAMTATLLRRRRDKLTALGLAAVDGLDLAGEGDELRRIADHPRYRIARVGDRDTAAARVREALNAGKRVLWVVNTVDRAQEIARGFAEDIGAGELTTAEGIPVFCYHSRYRLVDRRDWHEKAVSAFRPGAGETRPMLAVTTQVCEMSLDLDADLLVTEYAPVSSLVQRLGRCCRDTTAHEETPPRVGDVILYEPKDEETGKTSRAPYTADEMLGVADFVEKLLEHGRVSQSRLEDLLEDVPHTADLLRECRFIESGPWAASGEENFRDSDDVTRQALLPRDVEEYLDRRGEPKSWRAQELILPAPKKRVDTTSPADRRLPSWLGQVDARRYRYRQALGLCDERPDAIRIV